jgi:glutathione S-transferase
VVRRLYKEAFFGGLVSDETKAQVYDRLPLGLDAVNCLASFGPFILGETLTMADCAAYVHFTMIKLATGIIYNEDPLDRYIPRSADYMQMMDDRQHVRSMMAERADAMTAFRALGVPYDG